LNDFACLCLPLPAFVCLCLPLPAFAKTNIKIHKNVSEEPPPLVSFFIFVFLSHTPTHPHTQT